jgi:hypothetical protein
VTNLAEKFEKAGTYLVPAFSIIKLKKELINWLKNSLTKTGSKK